MRTNIKNFLKYAPFTKPLCLYASPKRVAFLYVLVIFIAFYSVILGNRTLYPYTLYHSTDSVLLAEGADRLINHGDVYQDAGASDLIEIPFVSVITKMLAGGELPLWDSYNCLGMPLIHNANNSMLAPLQQLPIFWNTEGMWNFMYLFRLWLIMFGTFLVCSQLKMNFPESFAAGIFAGLSGYVMIFLNIFFLHVDAFLPLLIYFSLRFCETKQTRDWVCSLLCVMAMSLGGNPQNLALNCLFCIVLLLGSYGIKNKIKTWILYILIYPVSVLLTLFYWLPFIVSYQRGYTGRGQMGIYHKSLSELLGLLYPGYAFDKYKSMLLPYAGISILCIILFQLRFKRNKTVKIALLVYVMLMLEKIGGGYLLSWVGKLPILDQFNFTKYNFSMYLAIAILAAYALNDFYAENVSKLRNALTAISLLVIWATYLYTYVAYKDVSGGVYVICVAGIVSTVLLCVFINKKKGILLIAAASLELIALCVHTNYFRMDKGYALDEPECISALKRMDQYLSADTARGRSRVFCVGKVLMGNLSSNWGIENISGISATQDKKYFDFMKSLVLNDNVDIQWVMTCSTEYYAESRKILNLLGVKYFIIDDYGVIEDENLTQIYDSGRLKIYYNPLAYDRCFTVHNLCYLDTKDDIFDFIGDEQNNLALTAAVPSDYHFEVSNELNSLNDQVELVQYSGNKISIKCTMGSNGLLVLSDLDFPGWNVYVNGKRDEIITTDYILRGVYLREGNYEIEFRYEPPEVFWGFGISISSALFGAFFWVIRHKRIKRRVQ